MFETFGPVYNIYEKIQMTAFSIQEFIISGIYVFETRRFLKSGASLHKENIRRVMRHLIYINLLIIFLDLTLLGTEYANQFMVEGIYKATVYSIKLRLEFSILNQLMAIAQGKMPGSSRIADSRFDRSKTREMAMRAFASDTTANVPRDCRADWIPPPTLQLTKARGIENVDSYCCCGKDFADCLRRRSNGYRGVESVISSELLQSSSTDQEAAKQTR
jgi:hypothetical protein